MNRKAKITVLGLMGSSVFMTVPHFHSVGETLSASSLYIEPGGKGCNQAVASARSGADVSFISCMGKDGIAVECLSFMEKEGIRCLTEYSSLAASPYACILTDSTGENQVTVHRGSAEFLSAEFVRSCENIIAESDILLLNNECPLTANMEALEIAQKYGVKAVLNPAPYVSLPIDYLKRFYLITPNRHEAAMLTGLSAESSEDALISALCEMGISRSAITLGAKGAAAFDGEKFIRCSATEVTAVDTTGAGDCFNGVLCCTLAEGYSFEKALDSAIRASGYSVSKHFVMPSLPRQAEWENMPH